MICNIFQVRAEQLLSDPINTKIIDMIRYYSEGRGMEVKLRLHKQKLAKYNAKHWFLRFFVKKPYHRDYMEIDDLYSRVPLPECSVVDKIKLLEAAKLIKPICWGNDWGDEFLIGITTCFSRRGESQC